MPWLHTVAAYYGCKLSLLSHLLYRTPRYAMMYCLVPFQSLESSAQIQPSGSTAALTVPVLLAECISELVRKAQGSGYVAALASGTLGAMAQSDAVRSVILQGEGTKPIVLMLARTNLALPGMPFCVPSRHP